MNLRPTVSTDKYDFNDFYLCALRKDVKTALAILDAYPDTALNDVQAEEKNRFYRRFREEEDLAFTSENQLVNDILTMFQMYWNSVLLEKVPSEQALNGLYGQVLPYLYQHYFQNTSVSVGELQNNAQIYVSDVLLKQGYYSHIGITDHIADICIWKKEEHQTFSVKLPEKEIDVNVVFILESVTVGWLEYATLGKFHTGGWALNDKLYCVSHGYDRESEIFLINFLTHEAQHFADYEDYPKLEQPDLEYRAKLAELSKAQATVYDFIQRFLSDRVQDRLNAHAFANHCLIRDLSTAVFGTNRIEDLARWKQVPAENINIASTNLLRDHSDKLRLAGRAEVTRLIE